METVLVTALSPPINLIIDKLTSCITKKVILPWQVKGKLENFREEMEHIGAVLKVADTSGRHTGEYWKKKLNYVLDDMNDLLDDIETQYLRKVMENQHSIWWKVVRSVGWKVSNNPLKIFHLFGYNNTIADIEKALAGIKKGTEEYNSMLKSVAVKHDSKLDEKWTPETQSSLGADSIEGLERSDEKEKIVEFLLSDNQEAFSLSIVGIGGLGKTELAKMVCNDDRIKPKFEVKWAHVSFREFDLGKMVCAILGDAKKEFTLEKLVKNLKQELHEKTCLFVLDDVWAMDQHQWNGLKGLLKINEGNKVLITTRYRPIAECADNNIIALKPSPDLCLQLIKKYAKLADPSQVPAEVIEKCEGVPLAAITLGLMMQKTPLPDGNVWSLTEPPEKDSNIMQSLKLSYDNLEFHVKRCFEYHAICNDDIDKERLMQMWIAQGFIQQTDEQKAFKKLECVSSFSDVEADISCQRTQFKVPRLFHHLAFLVSTDYWYIKKPNDKPASSSTARHVLLSAEMRTRQVPDSLFKLEKLRTFIGPHDIKLSRFKKLRVLDLRLSNFKEVPDSIDNMKHLRYLDLSENELLEELPRSIGKLFNLKTLRVDKCKNLKELPDNVGKLIYLKHLYVSSQQVSLEFRSLSSLQTLHLEDLCHLEKLPDMSHCTALETLEIFDCPLLCFGENGLKDVKNLRRLELVNLPQLVNFPKLATISEGEDHSDKKLTSLRLSKCGGLEKLPEWFRNLASLERLTIDDCHERILKDSSMVNHVKEIYLNKTRFQPTSSKISDCREPTQKPEKGGETGDDIHEGEGSRCTTVPESSNIASSSSDSAKRKGKGIIDTTQTRNAHQGNSSNGISIPNHRI